MGELTYRQILEMLQGGAKNVALGANTGYGVKGILEGLGKRGLNTEAESDFLKNVMGGATYNMQDEASSVLDHLTGAGVKTYNASGTDPLMMTGAGTAGTAVATGLNNVFPTIQNLGIGANSLGGDVMPQMNESQELLDSMTPDEANVYNQLEEFQRPAFLEGLRQNKISQYEAENFNRLTRPY